MREEAAENRRSHLIIRLLEIITWESKFDRSSIPNRDVTVAIRNDRLTSMRDVQSLVGMRRLCHG
jgi:hypothetical protein